MTQKEYADKYPTIVKAYNDAVLAQLKANNNTAWAGAQSVAVIEAICDEAYSLNEGFDAIRPLVKELCNASAFFAKLCKLDKADPFHIEHTPAKRGQSGMAMGILGKA